MCIRDSTQTGRTAGRLAGKSAKKLGMMKSRELHSMMMAEDTVQLRKDSIRDESQSKSWNLYENIRFAPIHGHTPMAPSLEAAPSKSALILGLASTAVGGAMDYKAAQAPGIGSNKPDQSSGGTSDPVSQVGEATTMASALEYSDPYNFGRADRWGYQPGSEIDTTFATGLTLD